MGLVPFHTHGAVHLIPLNWLLNAQPPKRTERLPNPSSGCGFSISLGSCQHYCRGCDSTNPNCDKPPVRV